MLALACSSKRTVVLLLLSTACTSTQTGATVNETALRKSNDRNPQEFRIAPPLGSTEVAKKSSSEKIEKLLSGDFENDEHSEVRLPAAAMGTQSGQMPADPLQSSREHSRMQRTDSEIGSISGYGEFEKRLGEIDRALDVSEAALRPMSPSFTLQTQKIRDLFREKRFEEALVEINELVIHYPRSSLLWTMKGTLHLRLSQRELSLAAYERAFDIEPSERLLAQIEDLRRLYRERESLRQQRNIRHTPSQDREVKTPPTVKPTRVPTKVDTPPKGEDEDEGVEEETSITVEANKSAPSSESEESTPTVEPEEDVPAIEPEEANPSETSNSNLSGEESSSPAQNGVQIDLPMGEQK